MAAAMFCSATAMPDVAAMTFGALGMERWLAFQEQRRWWQAVSAALLLTLAALARVTGKGEFYSLGTPTHPAHPTSAEGGPAAHLGTGAYALDQSFHHLWLLVAALLVTVL